MHVRGTGRIVDLHGRVVAEGSGELSAPLDRIATDVFLVDLEGANRYVMTKTATLAPLLDLPRARLELRDGVVRNTGRVAAVGVLAGDVVDLLPGEEREAAVAGPLAGWNVAD